MTTYSKELYTDEIVNKIYSQCIYTESDIEVEEGEYIDFLPIYDDKINTLNLTKEQYEKFEELCESPKVNLDRPNFSTSIGYDGGGYEYWTVQQEESNYANFTIVIKNPLTNDDLKEIKKANKLFFNEFDKIKHSIKV